MARKIVKPIHITISKPIKDMISEIAARQKMSISVLIRKCVFTDFQDETARVMAIDIYSLSETVKRIEDNGSNFCELLIREGHDYFDTAGEIYLMIDDIKELREKLYSDVNKIRQRVKKYCMKKTLDSQIAFLESEGSQGELQDMIVSLSEEEYESVKRVAKDEGVTISYLFRERVLSKCIVSEIYVDSYPMDEYTKELDKLQKLSAGIVSEVSKRRFVASDIENMKSTLEKTQNVLEGIHIPFEQKDTRKEANRILRK